MRCSAPGSGFFAPDGAGCLRRCISNAPNHLSVCRGRCPHRPNKNYEFAADFRITTYSAGSMWASTPTTINRTSVVRIPYVKYSTGANKATCFVYRALGKPDWAAAQRAFLTGRAIGEWYAESKCLFRRVSAISRLQRLFSPHSFLARQKRMGRRRHALCRAKKKRLKREISGLKTAYFLSKIAILPLCPTLSPNAAARSRTLI